MVIVGQTINLKKSYHDLILLSCVNSSHNTEAEQRQLFRSAQVIQNAFRSYKVCVRVK